MNNCELPALPDFETHALSLGVQLHEGHRKAIAAALGEYGKGRQRCFVSMAATPAAELVLVGVAYEILRQDPDRRIAFLADERLLSRRVAAWAQRLHLTPLDERYGVGSSAVDAGLLSTTFQTARAMYDAGYLDRFVKNCAVLVDEAHVAAADSFGDTLERFQPQRVFGATNIRVRADRKSLQVLGNCVLDYTLEDAIEDGIARDVELITFGSTNVGKSSDLRSLEHPRRLVFDPVDVLGHATRVIDQRISDAKVVHVCTRVAHARIVAAKLKARYPGKVDYVDGTLTDNEVSAMLSRFEYAEAGAHIVLVRKGARGFQLRGTDVVVLHGPGFIPSRDAYLNQINRASGLDSARLDGTVGLALDYTYALMSFRDRRRSVRHTDDGYIDMSPKPPVRDAVQLARVSDVGYAMSASGLSRMLRVDRTTAIDSISGIGNPADVDARLISLSANRVPTERELIAQFGSVALYAQVASRVGFGPSYRLPSDYSDYALTREGVSADSRTALITGDHASLRAEGILSPDGRDPLTVFGDWRAYSAYLRAVLDIDLETTMTFIEDRSMKYTMLCFGEFVDVASRRLQSTRGGAETWSRQDRYSEDRAKRIRLGGPVQIRRWFVGDWEDISQRRAFYNHVLAQINGTAIPHPDLSDELLLTKICELRAVSERKGPFTVADFDVLCAHVPGLKLRDIDMLCATRFGLPGVRYVERKVYESGAVDESSMRGIIRRELRFLDGLREFAASYQASSHGQSQPAINVRPVVAPPPPPAVLPHFVPVVFERGFTFVTVDDVFTINDIASGIIELISIETGEQEIMSEFTAARFVDARLAVRPLSRSEVEAVGYAGLLRIRNILEHAESRVELTDEQKAEIDSEISAELGRSASNDAVEHS